MRTENTTTTIIAVIIIGSTTTSRITENKIDNMTIKIDIKIEETKTGTRNKINHTNPM